MNQVQSLNEKYEPVTQHSEQFSLDCLWLANQSSLLLAWTIIISFLSLRYNVYIWLSEKMLNRKRRKNIFTFPAGRNWAVFRLSQHDPAACDGSNTCNMAVGKHFSHEVRALTFWVPEHPERLLLDTRLVTVQDRPPTCFQWPCRMWSIWWGWSWWGLWMRSANSLSLVTMDCWDKWG